MRPIRWTLTFATKTAASTGDRLIRMADHPESDSLVPPVAHWLQNGFHQFLGKYLRRHFHTIAMLRHSDEEVSLNADTPMIVYANHPSWWDPLIAHFLNRSLFAPRQFYAPIDAAALEQYKVFAKLGFYGIKADSKSGAADFLRVSKAILSTGSAAIWITPEGRFTDARDHSQPLMPGLAHLCSKMQTGYVVPMAFEYTFWDERLPLCLANLGTIINVSEHQSLTKESWSERLNDGLRIAQTQLADAAIERSPDRFRPMLSGKRGAGAIYDSFRRMKSWMTGREFQASHGDHFQ